jgi:hypothetical protein
LLLEYSKSSSRLVASEASSRNPCGGHGLVGVLSKMLGPEKDVSVGETCSILVVSVVWRGGVLGSVFSPSFSCSLEVLAKFNSLSQTSTRCVSLSHSSSRSLELDFSMLTKRALWWLVDKGKMVKVLAARGF